MDVLICMLMEMWNTILPSVALNRKTESIKFVKYFKKLKNEQYSEFLR